MKKLTIIITLLFVAQFILADTFEIDRKEFLLRVTGWTAINLSNNYLDNNLVSKPSVIELAKLDSDEINWLDQIALVDYSFELKEMSNYTAYFNLATASWLSYHNPGFRENLLVFAEILLTQDAIGKWTKTFSGRYRPFVYGDTVTLEKKQQKNSQSSFYSLHTSSTFSAATFGYYLHYQNHGHSWLYGTLLYGSAAATASLRVASAQHFPTDVISGAIIGSTVSYLICKSYQQDKVHVNVSHNSLGIGFNF